MDSDRSYGTAEGGNHATANGSTRNHINEHDSLLPKTQVGGKSSGLRDYLNANVSKRKADLILLFAYIITGLLDSTATAVWGSFVSMQTGNTIYVGLGLSNPTQSTRWIKSGTSILSFCAGSFIFARFHRAFSQKKRWVLMASTSIQLSFILASAVIATMKPIDDGRDHDKHWHVLLPLALLAFQSAGQAVISRAIQFNALTSVVLTSIYCDLFMDAKLFANLTENVERNRRAAAPLLLLAGAIFGGAWSRTDIGIAGALWTAAILKTFILLAWATWPAERPEESQ